MTDYQNKETHQQEAQMRKILEKTTISKKSHLQTKNPTPTEKHTHKRRSLYSKNRKPTKYINKIKHKPKKEKDWGNKNDSTC